MRTRFLVWMPLLAIGCSVEEPPDRNEPLNPVVPEPAPDHDEEAMAVPTPETLGGERQGETLCLQSEEVAFDCDLANGEELSVCETAGGALIRQGKAGALHHVVAIEDGEAAFVDAANSWDLQWTVDGVTWGVHGALDDEEPRVFFTSSDRPDSDGIACTAFEGDLTALAEPEL